MSSLLVSREHLLHLVPKVKCGIPKAETHCLSSLALPPRSLNSVPLLVFNPPSHSKQDGVTRYNTIRFGSISPSSFALLNPKYASGYGMWVHEFGSSMFRMLCAHQLGNGNGATPNNQTPESIDSMLNSPSNDNKLSPSAHALASQKAELLKAKLLKRGINSEISSASSSQPKSSLNDENSVENHYNKDYDGDGYSQSNKNSDGYASPNSNIVGSSSASSTNSSLSNTNPISIFPDDPDELIKMLQLDSEELFQEIITKQKEIEEITQEELKIQKEFKSETESELDLIKNLLLNREKELATMVVELQEAQSKFAEMQSRAVAELAKAQQEVVEKDLKLKMMEEALSELKKVTVEYWGEGNTVSFAGSFNGWQTTVELKPDFSSHIPKPDGSTGAMMWETDLWLYPGIYEIKFIVDGNWMVDPRRDTVMTNMGSNNVMHVE